MARPRKKGQLDWFKMTTHWDEKMEALLDECGAVGGFVMQTLWMHMYRTEDGSLPLASPLVKKMIAKKARCSVDELLSTIGVPVSVGLFEEYSWVANEVLFSNGVAKRLEENEESRDLERQKKDKGKLGENSGKLGKTRENEFSPNCSPLLSSDLISSDLISSEDRLGSRAREAEPKREVRPLVLLSEPEESRLRDDLSEAELSYWLDRLEEFAAQNPTRWKKNYRDHARVIRSWRNRKHEEGFVWSAERERYEKPPPTSRTESTALKPLSVVEHNQAFFEKRRNERAAN